MSTFPQKHIDIVGIGASTLDRFIVVDHYPTGREVQQVISSTTDGGGPVATALAVAGKYGARTAMIDSIGDDMVGRHILDDFEKYNVNTEAVQVESGANSGVATILVKQSTGERAVFFERSTATEPVFLETHKQLIESAYILHINGRHRQLMRSAEKYTGTTNLEDACRIIHERGALVAGVTDGANGSYFVWPDGTSYRCEPFTQATVVDTTGAGDSFHGAFLANLVHTINHMKEQDTTSTTKHDSASIHAVELLKACAHSDLEKAAIFASAVASLNTQGIGGRSPLPTLKSVQELIG